MKPAPLVELVELARAERAANLQWHETAARLGDLAVADRIAHPDYVSCLKAVSDAGGRLDAACLRGCPDDVPWDVAQVAGMVVVARSAHDGYERRRKRARGTNRSRLFDLELAATGLLTFVRGRLVDVLLLGRDVPRSEVA